MFPAGRCSAWLARPVAARARSPICHGLDRTDFGKIAVDGVPLEGDTRLRWQRSIAHVPQSIFLSDASIAETSPSASRPSGSMTRGSKLPLRPHNCMSS